MRTLLPPNYFSDEAYLNKYIGGLKPELRKDLRLHNPMSLFDATEIAMRSTALTTSAPGTKPWAIDFSTPASVANNNAGSDPMEIDFVRTSHPKRSFNKRGRNFNANKKGDQSNNWRNKFREVCLANGFCLNCGKPGHTKAQCKEASNPQY
ncbi:uncharacterized protein NDAI_0B01140 [Naumovozyma dairenensis CBS 421]|uniref:CCHC-type domain-containing protein n=1 Tax=Naumovozyma dairenensis (strain ATCC 10597 / BCRC 20456 / CBS 421 / NBRC 0211 / NRRL Y-12639) TaxID=1071378 RepID=G0W5T7_NAUDC|nr:hypothetical protein NDAI_0B01140 [Naumovozyma dairenensis CBS 421]CCD23148.1 hypothetical protein NDAI_0B01140 [Naumovozyma dairenensis CBS 421]